jgi:PAS domain S-box-containing protein
VNDPDTNRIGDNVAAGSQDGVSTPFKEIPAITPGLAFGFLAIVFVLVAGVLVALANVGTVYRATNAVAHTNDVKAQLEALLASLIDAETGERGFIITGNDSYLEPYNRGIAATATETGRVRQLTVDNPEQQADLERVAAETHVRLNELANAIQARRENGFEAAQAVVLTNVGKRTMDGIRALVARMEAREDRLLASRTVEAGRAYDRARLTALAVGGVGLVVVAALFVVTRRVGRERKAAVNLAEHLRVTLSSIGDGVIATDAAGRVTRVNPVAERLTGWSEADAARKPLEEIFVIVNEASRLPVDNPVTRVLREGVSVGLANHTVLIARNGSEIPVDDSAAPIKTAGGEVHGAVLVFRDVTERRRTEHERLNLIAELEAAVRARDDFLSIASHELRNPVNAVQLQLVGVLRAYQRGTDEVRPDELRDRVAQANGQVGRLTRLLDNLLDVSRISAGSIVLEPEELDLAEVVRSVIDQVRGESEDRQIQFGDREPVVGRLDRLRVEQVVSNLLSNAIKYGDGQPIVISLDHDGRSARLSVKDRGIGIAPDQHERLFARFERGVSRRQYGGFGLGLWITRQLVDAMGGSISVDSRPGHGATFSIVLPLDNAETQRTRTST